MSVFVLLCFLGGWGSVPHPPTPVMKNVYLHSSAFFSRYYYYYYYHYYYYYCYCYPYYYYCYCCCCYCCCCCY